MTDFCCSLRRLIGQVWSVSRALRPRQTTAVNALTWLNGLDISQPPRARKIYEVQYSSLIVLQYISFHILPQSTITTAIVYLFTIQPTIHHGRAHEP